jgi:hypothetical protein
MEADMGLTSIQKGKISETLVASTLMLASGGRLSPFVPLSDDCGIDLIVVDKETCRSLCIQVKSRIENPQRPTVQFGVGRSSFRASPERYLLGVLFNPANPALTTSWFIPMTSVPALAVQKSDIYAVTPAVASTSNDRYRSHRNDSASELVDAILRAINGDVRHGQPANAQSLGLC